MTRVDRSFQVGSHNCGHNNYAPSVSFPPIVSLLSISLMLYTLILILLAFPLTSLSGHDCHSLSRGNHFRLAHRANAIHLNKRCNPMRKKYNDASPSPNKSRIENSLHNSIAKITGLLNVKSNCGDIGATSNCHFILEMSWLYNPSI